MAADSKLWRYLKGAFAVLVCLLFVGLGPYLVSRLCSPGRQVRIYSETSQDTPQWQSSLRVLTYNIAHGRGPSGGNWDGSVKDDRRRIEQIAQLIREEDPDIVVLNEVDFSSTWSGHQNQAVAIADLAGYPHRVEQRNFDLRFIYGSWKFGNAVLSKFPIVDAVPLEFPVNSDWEHALAGSKQGVICTLQLAEDQQVQVVPVHFEYRGEATRVASAETLIESAAATDFPMIAAGDFNSTPTGSAESRQTKSGDNALDLLTESEEFHVPTLSFNKSDLTFPSTEPQSVIDWILIPKSARFADYRAIDTDLSDHRPVVATIELSPD